jgi:rod shape-determining protein MreD
MTLYSYILLNLYKIMPIFITLIFILISVSPIMPAGSEEIAPLLGVISLAFWILYKPDNMGWAALIMIGVFSDSLYGSVLGVSCLANIIIRLTIIKLLLRIKNINIYITLLYIGISLIIWLILHSLIQSLIYIDVYNYYTNIYQFFISLAIAPIIIFFQLFLLKKMYKS